MTTHNLMPGCEQHQPFWSFIIDCELVQYDYRDSDGELFSTVASTLGLARMRRDAWLGKKAMQRLTK